MTFLSDLVFILMFLLRALFEALLGRRRCRYSASTFVKAPRSVVWGALSAREITFEGATPVTIKMADQEDAEGLIRGTISMFGASLPLTIRELEMRPDVGGVIEIIPEGTAPQIALGHDYFVSFVLTETSGGTRLDLMYELTHTSFMGRVLVPLGAIQNARRMKHHSEKLVGVETQPESAVGAAVLTGLITFASFFILWGLDAAALLVATILIHEVGHVLAMRCVGQPVRGIYFIPFFGGVAVASEPHQSEAKRGFVALMGPGFSVLSTLVFWMLWRSNDNDLLGELTFISAFLNVINLAPVMPLDGGQVVASLLSRADPELKRVVHFVALLIATGVGFYFEVYSVIVIWLLTLPQIFSDKDSTLKPALAPISRQASVLLSAAYAATIAVYLTIISVIMA